MEKIGFDMDHLHMIMVIPPKYSIANVMGTLKSKSSSLLGLSEGLCKLQKGKDFHMLSGVELQNSKRGKHIIKFPTTINSSMVLGNIFELTTYEVIL